MPRVSVVLPVFNGARYLEHSVRSVLAQDLDAFELLICDDASSDDSLAVVSGFEDPRVRVLVNERNRGLFPTLNRLIATARAPLIRLWAQDDVMYPQCLREHAAFHDAHPELAMSFCNFDLLDAEGQVTLRPEPDHTPSVMSPLQASELMFFHGSIPGNIANVMLTRAGLDAVGSFREDLRVSGDFELWVRLTERLPIGRVANRLMALRSHAGQFSRKRGIAPTFMEENEAVFDALHARLAPELQAYGRRYRRRQCHTMYAHQVVRSLLDRDFRAAWRSYRVLARTDRPALVFGWWLLTANRRWLQLPPRHAQF